MASTRVDTAHLLPDLRRTLIAMLRPLSAQEWDAATVCGDWAVRDVASHLLAVDLSYVARRRDGTTVEGPRPAQPLAEWLGEFNEQWVQSSRRLSGRVLTDLLDISGAWFEEVVASLDLDATGEAVSWAGGAPAPVWLDVAREFTERWTHQQQIRDALGWPPLGEERFVAPLIATFVHALPVALGPVVRPEASAVNFGVVGAGGGAWHVVRRAGQWELEAGSHPRPLATATLVASDAWRLFTRHPSAIGPHVDGDAEIGAALGGVVAIIA